MEILLMFGDIYQAFFSFSGNILTSFGPVYT